MCDKGQKSGNYSKEKKKNRDELREAAVFLVLPRGREFLLILQEGMALKPFKNP